MKKIRRLGTCLFIIFFLCFGNVQMVFGGLTGNDLKELCVLEGVVTSNENERLVLKLLHLSCLNYVQGTINGWVAGMIMGTRDEMADVNVGGICIPKSSTTEQWKSIVTKWLKGHPEKLHNSATLVIIQAIKEAFPCGGPNTLNNNL